MKLSEDKKLAPPRRICQWQRRYLDQLWTSSLQTGALCMTPCFTAHIRRPSHSRGQRCSLSALVWWASLLVNPVFATICDSAEALSIMVFSDKLQAIKFSSSSSVSLFHHCTESNWPSTILHNSLKNQLKHQFFFFSFFLVWFLNKAFLTTIPLSAPSNGPHGACFFIWQIITYLPTWCLSFLVREDSGFKMGTRDLCSGFDPCWKWSPHASVCSNENVF